MQIQFAGDAALACPSFPLSSPFSYPRLHHDSPVRYRHISALNLSLRKFVGLAGWSEPAHSLNKFLGFTSYLKRDRW